MRNQRPMPETVVWAALAFAAGIGAGLVDRQSAAVQAPALAVMIAAFALTLPGRVSTWIVAPLVAVGIPLVGIAAGKAFNPGWIVVLVPAFIAAAGGQLVGRLLEHGAESAGPRDAERSWRRRPIPTRVLLAGALVSIAAAATPIVHAALRDADHPLAAWLGTVWQIITLLAWIGATPVITRLVPSLFGIAASDERDDAPSAVGCARHLVVVLAFVPLHVMLLLAACALLFIPILPSARDLAVAAVRVYLPLDTLAYLAIVSVARASDAERRARAANAREAAHRLTALRARLNPHFLFNALNGAEVLARAGDGEATSRVLSGLAMLLRYVLDERRAVVPFHEELAFARHYFDVQRIRFAERLRATFEIELEAEGAIVPQLLLQPIVENAVEHGGANSIEGGTVSIAARRDGDVLEITVDDDGPGLDADSPRSGIGLSTTRERLARMFGARASLRIAPSRGGGVRVEIRLPYVRAHAEP